MSLAPRKPRRERPLSGRYCPLNKASATFSPRVNPNRETRVPGAQRMVAVSWLELDPANPFGVANLPYGSFAPATGGPWRAGVRIGDHVLDLAGAEQAGLLSGAELFAGVSNLDQLLAAGRPMWTVVRSR